MYIQCIPDHFYNYMKIYSLPCLSFIQYLLDILKNSFIQKQFRYLEVFFVSFVSLLLCFHFKNPPRWHCW